jgi:iron complex outermembrane receptor protein
MLLPIVPSQGHTDDVAAPSDRVLSEELQLLREEESVSIELREGQPIFPLSSRLCHMTDEDIRSSGAADLPTLLRLILGLDVPQGARPAFDDCLRVDNQFNPNRLLLVVDGRSIHINLSDAPPWDTIPVTLPDIARIEVWNEASAIHGLYDYDAVINISTKTPVR